MGNVDAGLKFNRGDSSQIPLKFCLGLFQQQKIVSFVLVDGNKVFITENCIKICISQVKHMIIILL